MRTALYYIRSRCNYSQSMVARELHVSRQMLSAWENGTKPIPNARKAELADMFGIEKEKLDETDIKAVSYTHLTLPTILLV